MNTLGNNDKQTDAAWKIQHRKKERGEYEEHESIK